MGKKSMELFLQETYCFGGASGEPILAVAIKLSCFPALKTK
ncbi:MAG: hypothetical protein ACTSQD_09120 [Promethearchaeota archaeon]